MYTIGQLSEVLSDDAKLVGLCRDLLALVPASESRELLLSQAWKYAASEQRWAKATMDTFTLGITRNWSLLGYERRSYNDLDGGEQIPARYHQLFWRNFIEHGALIFQSGPIEDQRKMSLGLFTIVSIGVLFWLIWNIVHWGAQFVLRRVQKRRVLLNQCIFCAYPLTAEAVNARYPVEAT